MNAHSDWDIDGKVEELVASPIGCAFLIILEASELSAADAARPEVSLQVAYRAVDEMSIWAPDFQELMQYALMHGRRLRGLARAVLEQPRMEWWFAPIARESQIWIANDDAPPSADKIGQSNLQMTRWEQRTNKSESALYTCTSFQNKTSIFTALDLGSAHGANEISMCYTLPVKCWRMRVSESARVFEINSAWDWHNLSVSYPMRSARDASDPESDDMAGWGVYPMRNATNEYGGSANRADMDKWLTPDWNAVAADWDGVHLTLFGLLTAEKLRVASAAGWSLHRFWDVEQAMWLRWAFDKVERLQDYDAMPLPIEAEFPYADYWKFRDALGKDYGQAIATYTVEPS